MHTAKRIPRNVATADIERGKDGRADAKQVLRAVHARILGMSPVKKAVAPKGREPMESNAHGTRRLIEPPFDPLVLSTMPENSSEMAPAIEAMAVNTEWFGWRTQPRIPIDDRTSLEIHQTLADERVRAENFFEGAVVEDSLEEFREKLRNDLETCGNFYVELVEDPLTRRLDGLNHVPAWMVRISVSDEYPHEYVAPRVVKEVRVVEGDEPGTVVEEVRYRIVEETRFKRFRRYAQVKGGKPIVWFKEVGDPRVISSETGEVVSSDDFAKKHDSIAPRYVLRDGEIAIVSGRVGYPVAKAANPLAHKRLYSGRSPYGLPRYIGKLFSIFGSRASEEINYATFKNNNIPSAVITVSNGQLTDESLERLEEFVETAIASDDNYSKFLLIEGEPVMEGMRDPGSMKIDIKPLTKEQHTDAMFVNYREQNDESVRRAWRYPPIFVGKSEDFSGKTIEASRKLADEQVFSVERKRVDDFWTKHIFVRYLRIAWSTFKSNSPNVTENADLLRALVNGEKIGAMTPEIGREILSTIVNRDLGRIDPTKLDPSKPLTLTLAEIMKGVAPATGGGETNSQGRTGSQAPSDGTRDRESEPGFDSTAEEDVERLRRLLAGELEVRFGGILPPAWAEDEDLD